MPEVDSQQDYELISLKEEDGKTIMKIKRKFDTCDSEDNKIEVSWLSFNFFFFHFSNSWPRKSGLAPGSFDVIIVCKLKSYIHCMLQRKEIPVASFKACSRIFYMTI